MLGDCAADVTKFAEACARYKIFGHDCVIRVKGPMHLLNKCFEHTQKNIAGRVKDDCPLYKNRKRARIDVFAESAARMAHKL